MYSKNEWILLDFKKNTKNGGKNQNIEPGDFFFQK